MAKRVFFSTGLLMSQRVMHESIQQESITITSARPTRGRCFRSPDQFSFLSLKHGRGSRGPGLNFAVFVVYLEFILSKP